MEQQIQNVNISKELLIELGRNWQIGKFFVVCGNSFHRLSAADALRECGIPYVTFSSFSPNPVYEDICLGVNCFLSSGCDAILAIGGGSAMDVAKCISIFCELPGGQDFLQQAYLPRKVLLIAAPTTAGTGSESTGFAVVYKDGEKISVKSDFMLPDIVLLDSSLLKGLPDYHRKSAMMDAFCQALESWWSIKSTPKSVAYSREAITLISRCSRPYLEGNADAAKEILLAANLSGHAIQITQTTAAHAMSYKLTSLYGLAHGHAVALCFSEVWKYMLSHLTECVDGRGQSYLSDTFQEMAVCMGYRDAWEAADGFAEWRNQLGLLPPAKCRTEQIPVLVKSVNVERLGNNPVKIDYDELERIYYEILFQSKRGA